MKKEIKPLDEKIELMNIAKGDRYHPMVDTEEIKNSIQNLQEELKEVLPDELYEEIGTQGFDRNWKQPDGEETYWELINKIINKLFLKHIGKGLLK